MKNAEVWKQKYGNGRIRKQTYGSKKKKSLLVSSVLLTHDSVC